jgi:hypothetical protein
VVYAAAMLLVFLELSTNNFGGYEVEEKLHLGIGEQNG